MIAWEFCHYRNNTQLEQAVFYPSIWSMIPGDHVTDYQLIQSNTIMYNQSSGPCQRVNLSTTDRFTAPARSVVGLYSNVGAQLRLTNTDSSITTYKLSGSQSCVRITGNSNVVNYNIAIRLHLIGT